MSIKSQEYSKIGDGNLTRCTTHYENGSVRTVDERTDGGITVTDTDSTGKSVSGEGARGFLDTLSGAVRLNGTPGKV